MVRNFREVEKVLEAKKAKEEQTKATEKKKRRSRHRFDAAKFEDDGGENVVGHSMFEDDDDDENRGGGIKIKVQRRTVKKKGGGAASSPSKSSASAYSKPKTSTVPVNKSFGKTTVGGKGKKKRKREEEEDDFYENKFFKKGNSNRRERGSARERMPHVIFADRLEGIRASVERRSNSGAFHRPVSRRDIPRYYEVVSQPISLLEIGDRISKYSYKTADAMVADFDLMVRLYDGKLDKNSRHLFLLIPNLIILSLFLYVLFLRRKTTPSSSTAPRVASRRKPRTCTSMPRVPLTTIGPSLMRWRRPLMTK